MPVPKGYKQTPEHIKRRCIDKRRASLPESKICSLCEKDKPASAYGIRKLKYRNGEDATYYCSECRQCQKERSNKIYHSDRTKAANIHRSSARKWRYGITPAVYEQIKTKQENLCAVCHKPPPEGKHLFVDHCHSTGRIRGLLCGRCNLGIGHFDDSPKLFLAVIEYLQQETSFGIVPFL